MTYEVAICRHGRRVAACPISVPGTIQDYGDWLEGLPKDVDLDDIEASAVLVECCPDCTEGREAVVR